MVKIDNVVVDITTQTTGVYTFTQKPSVVSVQSVNEYGALSVASVVEVGNSSFENPFVDTEVSVYASDGKIIIRGIEKDTDITVCDIAGRLVKAFSCHRNVSFAMPQGLYIVKIGETVSRVLVR